MPVERQHVRQAVTVLGEKGGTLGGVENPLAAPEMNRTGAVLPLAPDPKMRTAPPPLSATNTSPALSTATPNGSLKAAKRVRFAIGQQKAQMMGFGCGSTEPRCAPSPPLLGKPRIEAGPIDHRTFVRA